DLAMPIGADAAARAVAHLLRAVHRAGHAGVAQAALTAHPAIEEEPLHRPLDPRHRLLQTLVAEAAHERIERHHGALEALVTSAEAARMARRPQAHAVHRSSSR